MPETIAKKDWNIDQPMFPTNISQAGCVSGWVNLTNPYPNPKLNKPTVSQFTTQMNSSPTLNTPSVAWT